LANWIIEHLPAHRVYVEPFGGAASVLLRKARSHSEVYNDLDGEVVNLFRVVRENGEELVRSLELTSFSREEFVESYCKSNDPLEQARRTVIRSFMGFGSNSHERNTGFRCYARHSGTSPAGDWRNYPDALRLIIDRLRGVVIENRDAIEIMQAHDGEDTVHYVDPPYMTSTRDKGKDYRHELTDSDHETLAEVLLNLKGMVVLSGYKNNLYEDFFCDWVRTDRAAYADGAKKRVESLWLSPNCRSNDLFGEYLARPLSRKRKG